MASPPESPFNLRPGIEYPDGEFFPARRYATSAGVSSRISQRLAVRSAAQR